MFFLLKTKRIFSTVSLLLALFFAQLSFAAVTPPDVVVKSTLERALSELQQRRSEFAASPEKLSQAINDILGPAINFELFSKGVLGKHRRTITPEQFNAFVVEFKRLLIDTYANTVFEFSGESINYLPFSNPQNKDRVKVKTEFITKNNQKIPMTFSMNIRDDSEWKVYNIKIQTPEATIELIPLFRSDYSDRISKSGIEHLINELRKINNG